MGMISFDTLPSVVEVGWVHNVSRASVLWLRTLSFTHLRSSTAFSLVVHDISGADLITGWTC